MGLPRGVGELGTDPSASGLLMVSDL
jgi:hypothetical protein